MSRVEYSTKTKARGYGLGKVDGRDMGFACLIIPCSTNGKNRAAHHDKYPQLSVIAYRKFDNGDVLPVADPVVDR
jgi:hypothetical protein